MSGSFWLPPLLLTRVNGGGGASGHPVRKLCPRGLLHSALCVLNTEALSNMRAANPGSAEAAVNKVAGKYRLLVFRPQFSPRRYELICREPFSTCGPPDWKRGSREMDLVQRELLKTRSESQIQNCCQEELESVSAFVDQAGPSWLPDWSQTDLTLIHENKHHISNYSLNRTL